MQNYGELDAGELAGEVASGTAASAVERASEPATAASEAAPFEPPRRRRLKRVETLFAERGC